MIGPIGLERLGKVVGTPFETLSGVGAAILPIGTSFRERNIDTGCTTKGFEVPKQSTDRCPYMLKVEQRVVAPVVKFTLSRHLAILVSTS